MHLIDTIQAAAATVPHIDALLIWGAALAGTTFGLVRGLK